MGTFNLITALVFIGAIVLEALLNAKDDLDHYEKADSKTNFTIASIGVIVNLVAQGTLLSAFIWIKRYSNFDVGTGSVAWIVGILLVDLQYFLFHVLSHKSRFFWAMHVIHHSSHKFNLTTAIRTPFTNSFFRFASLAPLVLIGFNPLMIIFVNTIIGIITFFQHTEMVKKLGWLEYILNTPSHHRVHHASNEKYLDKNYGGILIIWDKLFGTFQKEEEKPVYGLTKPLKNKGFVNVLTHEWRAILKDVWHAKKLSHKFCYVFGKPGWKPRPVEMKSGQQYSFLSTIIARRVAFIVLLLTITFSIVHANSPDELVHQGIVAEKKLDEQSALNFYEKAILENPRHVEALWRASRMLSNAAGRSADKSSKIQYASRAKTFSKQAMGINPVCKEARLCYIIALGLLSEAASSPSEKLANAKIIYAEAEAVLKIDSLNAPAYYVLGKWHFELAKLNWAEKLACNLLFGGVPNGVSFDKSIRYFEKAIHLQPDYILFHYGRASAFYYMGKYDKAIPILESALKLAPVEPDDEIRKQKCVKMLEESKEHYTKA